MIKDLTDFVGADLNFSEEGLITMHNNELADVLGNLVNRVLSLCQNYSSGSIPDSQHDTEFGIPFDLNELKSEVQRDLETAAINLCVFKGMNAARSTNQ
jgi:methionyl-tRNA synthetase